MKVGGYNARFPPLHQHRQLSSSQYRSTWTLKALLVMQWAQSLLNAEQVPSASHNLNVQELRTVTDLEHPPLASVLLRQL